MGHNVAQFIEEETEAQAGERFSFKVRSGPGFSGVKPTWALGVSLGLILLS